MSVLLLHQSRIAGKALSHLLEKAGYQASARYIEEFFSSDQPASTGAHLLIIDVPSVSVRFSLHDVSTCRNNILLLGRLDQLHWFYHIRKPVKGYICKEEKTESLFQGLKAIQNGNDFLSPYVRHFFQAYRYKQQAMVLKQELDQPLTKTELKIMHAISSGCSSKQIAKEQFRSIHTIYNHRKNIRRKLQISPEANLSRYCILKRDAILTLESVRKETKNNQY